MRVYVSHFSAASAVFTQRLESLREVLNKDTCFALKMTAQQSLCRAFPFELHGKNGFSRKGKG